MVDGHATTLYLEPLTEYSIMVAAVNSNGTGQFSEPVYITTAGEKGLTMSCYIINCVFVPQ